MSYICILLPASTQNDVASEICVVCNITLRSQKGSSLLLGNDVTAHAPYDTEQAIFMPADIYIITSANGISTIPNFIYIRDAFATKNVRGV